MAQTTGFTAGVNNKIEVSANGSSWTDISGSASSVDPGEQSGASGEAYTFSGDNAVITAGKNEPIEVDVKIVYTETGGEAFETVRAIWQTSGRACYIRWSPKGGTTGQFLFTSGAGVLTGFSWPPTDASDGKPVMAGFKIKVATLTKSVL